MASQLSTTTPPVLSPGVFGNFRFDVVAGFLVFLIAMPLCLAISRASGFPPIAGIWTAVIGGLVTTFLSNAELTIKGPAAGLIVIVAGAVSELGKHFGADLPDADRAFLGYKLALGIGVAAGVIQMLFGLIKAGRLADFFPLTPVHGMLASIGIIIIVKQLYDVIGAAAPTAPAGGEPPSPFELIWAFPGKVATMNPEIAAIGIVALVILFGLQVVKTKWVRKVPAQLVVLIVAIGMGSAFKNIPAHVGRRQVHDRVDRLRNFRNKVMHHYAIFDQHPLDEHENAMKVVGWVSADLHWFAKQLTNPQAAMANKPRV